MESGGIVLCTWFGEVDPIPEEALSALTLGRRSAEALGTHLTWLILGAKADAVARVGAEFGVSAIRHASDPALSGKSPDALVSALEQFCSIASPRLVLVCQDFESRVVAPRAAGRIGAAVVMNGLGIELAAGSPMRVTASAYGGDTQVVYEVEGEGTSIVAVQANSVLPQAASAPTECRIEAFDTDLSGVKERVSIVKAARSEGPRLEEAEIIVSGGRGLSAPENYKLVEQLAEALGGMAGASRPLVDEGWIDSSHQVGLTGHITRPALYVAAGISGASQHMAGCGAAKTIAAINSDPAAAIFRYARYGIVGDCLEILPELIRAAQEEA